MTSDTNNGVASATLTSSIANTARWFGAGTANVSWTPPADLAAVSRFLTDFDVTSAVNYAFIGSLAASGSACCSIPSARAFAQLGVFGVDEDGDPVVLPLSSFTRFIASSDRRDVPGALTRSFSGLLTPGRYELLVDAFGSGFAPREATLSGSAAANFAFTLDFTPADSSPSPTPEPTSLLLLGTAIAGAFGFRSRSRPR